MTTAQLLQRRIDAQQALDTIEYGLRADKALNDRRYWRAAIGTAEHVALTAQLEAAEQIIGEGGVGRAFRFYALRRKRELRAELTAAKEAVKAIGTTRQLRLALAA